MYISEIFLIYFFVLFIGKLIFSVNVFSLLILYCFMLDISVNIGLFLKFYKIVLYSVCKVIVNKSMYFGLNLVIWIKLFVCSL